ncbi:ankyrin [Cadophora sp. DSE1049]|nr:ankyrin [Cadophora sp. DSE1049]
MEDCRWEPHKDTMQRYFLIENKTLDEVMKLMEDKFHASKAQYERQFKKWKFRKHRKQHDWASASRIIKKRKRGGKGSDVYIDGVLIETKKICKETSRHDRPTYGQVASPKTPEGFYICTPLASLSNNYLLINLPWFQFQAKIESRGSPYPDLAAAAANLFVSCAGNTIQSRLNSISSTKSTAGVPGEIISVMASWTTTISLTERANPIRNVHSRLRAILPEQLDGELLANAEDLPGLIKLDENAQYLSLAMYLMSNNMLEDKDLSRVVGYFEHQRGRRLLKSLLSVKVSTVDAFAEKLLVAAAKAEKAMIIKEVLEAGTDPNIWDGWSDKTPLHYVVERGNKELVLALVDAGADVNAHAVREEEDEEVVAEGASILQAAAGAGNIELVQILLAADAYVNALPAYRRGITALQAAAIKGYVGIATMLLDAGAHVNAQAASEDGRTALEGAAEHGRIDMVKLLLSCGVELSGSGDAQYRKALELASKYGHNTAKKLIQNHVESGGNE